MRRTFFDTPILTPVLRLASRCTLALLGWRIEGTAPAVRRYVMVAAPHTSNWDGIFLVMMAQVLRIKIFWLGKHTLFRAPFGPLVRWLGGIAVDRRRSTDLVSQVVEKFEQSPDLIVVVAPAGTRSQSNRWRTGFYVMAVKSRVPIALGYLDYKNRIGGIGPMLEPTGDLEADLPKMDEFYADKTGKNEAAVAGVEETAR